MKYTPTLARLIDSLRCLPGVGPKSAQRMAFYLLERDRDGGRTLSQALAEALQQVGHCKRCRMLTESELCAICASTQRDLAQLCVVESPADVVAIEQSGGFRGRYFVLMGHLSPLDGVGPAELGLDEFEQLLKAGEVREVILATNPTAEGEATAHYLGELALRLGHQGIAHRARRPGGRRAGVRRWRHPGACARRTHQCFAKRGRASCLGRELFVQPKQPPIAFVAARGNLLVDHGAAHRAARLLHVPAILESALRAARMYLDESRAPRRAPGARAAQSRARRGHR